MSSQRLIFTGGIALAFALCILLLILWSPRVSSVVVHYNGTTIEQTQLPVDLDAVGEKSSLDLRFLLEVRPFQFHRMQLWGDDCFEQLTINGKDVTPRRCPEENSREQPLELVLSSLVHTGMNVVTARVKDTRRGSIGFDLFPSKRDPLFLLILVSICALCTLCCVRFAREYINRDHVFITAIILGVILRFVYATSTSPFFHAYDAGAHIEYVEYLTHHISLPPASGWEFHQPPLYYAIAALIVRTGTAVHLPSAISMLFVQWLSALLSIGTLLAGAGIFAHLFRAEKNPLFLRLSTLLAAVFPGLIMMSSRISNDPAITFLTALAVWCIVHWWRTESRTLWHTIWIIAGLAFLTKLSGIAIPAIAVLCMLCARTLPMKEKFRSIGIGLLIFIAMTSWLPAARLSQSAGDVNNYLSLGKAGMNGALHLDHTLKDFITFNPVAMIRIPFANPWSDESRRKNYFEYYVRSSLFGEFSDFRFSELARPLLTLALLLLGWMLAGVYKTIRDRRSDALPLLLGAGCVFVMALAYAILFPYASEEDFRFSAFLGIAASYFVVRGIAASPTFLRLSGAYIVTFFGILSTIFLLAQTRI